jgi:hypothetical protein
MFRQRLLFPKLADGGTVAAFATCARMFAQGTIGTQRPTVC